jgi:hypothetical protein
MATYRNQRAAERTITALRNLGRLEPVDDGTLAALRTVSAALDEVDVAKHPAAVASLARVQLAALKMLRMQADDDSDTLTDLLASVSTSVGDAEES